MTTPIGVFGAPPDAAAWAALVVGVILLVRRAVRSRTAIGGDLSDRVFVVALAVTAALLSTGYVSYYLRGGPRIIDATSYFLEARGFSEGHISLPVLGPSGSYRGRFLLAGAEGRAVSVIFPPGYPAVLALGFLVNAPMLVGPMIAALLVMVTFAVTKRLFGDRRIARLAAALSTVCAVLRYHTADTMSHGLAALLFAAALWAALDGRARMSVLAGAAVGGLVATRPVTGILCLALVLVASETPRRWPMVLAGAALPVLGFLFEQRAATGKWLTSSQAAYYRLADSPLGCFRYGFGSGVGCRFEHGDFVRAHLADGYGIVAAFGTTLRRLKMHLGDAANTELFFPVVVYAVAQSIKKRRGVLASGALIGVVLAYAPFYFDGNYPGGGARFYADALPFEHALLASGLLELGLGAWAIVVALFGFALHTSYDHRQLAEREGGRPMFERTVVERAGVRRGLLFVSTDHGFDLGFDPAAAIDRTLLVARRRFDAHDTELWLRLGRPPAYDYSFDPSRRSAVPSILPLVLTPTSVRRFEAESEWPPLRISGGSVEPVFPPCASRGRALRITPTKVDVPAEVEIEVAGRTGMETLRVGWAAVGAAEVRVHLGIGGTTWDVAPTLDGGCAASDGPALGRGETAVLSFSIPSPVAIDFVELRPAE